MDQEPIRLVVAELIAIDRWCHQHLPLPLAFLIQGLLVALQERIIAYKAKDAVDTAIKTYEAQEVKPPDPLDGIYSESGSGFFDEMRIKARFIKDNETPATDADKP